MAKSIFKNAYKSGKNDPIQYFSVEIYDVDLSVVNGIKRIIQSEINLPGFYGEDNPTVNIFENNGPLHNEILSHRIGLIPIHFNDDEVETYNHEDYLFELEVENDTASMMNVTTEQMKVFKKGSLVDKAEIKRLFPANPLTNSYILITRLRPKEKLHFKATAMLGTAGEYAGFSPVSLCTFHYLEDPKLIAHLPYTATILDRERSYLRNEYGDPTAIKFELEIECGLTAKYLVSKAIEVFMNKLNKTLNEVMSDNSDYISIVKPDSGNGYKFVFENETDTLGNFLQSNMHNYYIRAKNLTTFNKTMTYVGYMCPHPLEKTMELMIIISENKINSSSSSSGESDATGTTTNSTDTTTTTSGGGNKNPMKFATNKSEYIEVLSEQCRRSLSYLQEIKSQWLLSV